MYLPNIQAQDFFFHTCNRINFKPHAAIVHISFTCQFFCLLPILLQHFVLSAVFGQFTLAHVVTQSVTAMSNAVL